MDFQEGVKKLTGMDAALFARVDRIASAIKCGEYAQAKMLCRYMEDDLQRANTLANKLADVD